MTYIYNNGGFPTYAVIPSGSVPRTTCYVQYRCSMEPIISNLLEPTHSNINTGLTVIKFKNKKQKGNSSYYMVLHKV
jgi:hypothetical protein